VKPFIPFAAPFAWFLVFALLILGQPGCRSPRRTDGRTPSPEAAPGVGPWTRAAAGTSRGIGNEPPGTRSNAPNATRSAGLETAPATSPDPSAAQVGGAPAPPAPGCIVSLATQAGPIDCRMSECPESLAALAVAASVTARPVDDETWVLEATRSRPPLGPEPSVKLELSGGAWTIDVPTSIPGLQVRAGCTGPADSHFGSPRTLFVLEGILLRRTF